MASEAASASRIFSCSASWAARSFSSAASTLAVRDAERLGEVGGAVVVALRAVLAEVLAQGAEGRLELGLGDAERLREVRLAVLAVAGAGAALGVQRLERGADLGGADAELLRERGGELVVALAALGPERLERGAQLGLGDAERVRELLARARRGARSGRGRLCRASSSALRSAAVETPSLAASPSRAGPKPGPGPPWRRPKPPRRKRRPRGGARTTDVAVADADCGAGVAAAASGCRSRRR